MRQPRRGASGLPPTEELKLWSMFFEAGVDYFSDLKEVGVDADMDDEEFASRARDVWQMLGQFFMASWRPTIARPRPWALEQFGEPG